MSTDGDRSSHSVALPLIVIIGLITLVATLYSIVNDPGGTDGIRKCTSVPDEAIELIDAIHAGGPFPYPTNDGKHFGNYERILPEENPDYYSEYTVSTPGVNHRGERRIVTGGGTPTDPEVYYYTDDHYESFCEMDVK